MKHNFIDTPSGICICTLNEETTHHFLLECPIFASHRRNLIRNIDSILLLNDLVINDSNKVHLLLYGHEKLTFTENRMILKSTIKFISQSCRFAKS